MARVRSVDTWEIDWADDGYQHAAADVTPDYLDYQFRYGLNASANDESLINVPARGALVLNNSAGTYSSETSKTITRPELRKRHAVRLYSANETLWEGTGRTRAAGSQHRPDR